MGKGIILGVLLGIALVFAGAYFYFATGHAPVGVTDPEMPFERKFAGMALHAYMNKQPHTASPYPKMRKIFWRARKCLRNTVRFATDCPANPEP